MKEYSPKLYSIKTFGCQANIADSNKIAGILESIGFEELEIPKFKTEVEEMKFIISKADLFIINTCSVRQKSEDKVYGIGKMLKDIKKRAFIVLSGCMVGSVSGERQRFELKELRRKTPWVDLFITPAQVNQIPELLLESGFITSRILKNEVLTNFYSQVVPKQDNSKHAYINISNGCDNFCTYCVVPYSRGAEVSRSEEDIMREITSLVKKGVNHITLCGQNVNSWGLGREAKFKIRTGSSDKLPFTSLLRSICTLPEVERVDFLSSNPFDFTQDLIDTLALPKVGGYLHVAVQSGNNEVLKRMNRRHTVEEFLDLIDRIKKVRPEMEIGTDIIVGFPGETEQQFMDTVKLFEKVRFAVAYIAMYSARKGTNAQKMFIDDVSPQEKKRRLAYLTKVWKGSKVKRI